MDTLFLVQRLQEREWEGGRFENVVVLEGTREERGWEGWRFENVVVLEGTREERERGS